MLPATGSAARTRLGISVSKRVGNAVVRNRVRRRLREIFRHTRASTFSTPVSLVVNARPSAAAVAFRELSEDYAATVRRALARVPRP